MIIISDKLVNKIGIATLVATLVVANAIDFGYTKHKVENRMYGITIENLEASAQQWSTPARAYLTKPGRELAYIVSR